MESLTLAQQARSSVMAQTRSKSLLMEWEMVELLGMVVAAVVVLARGAGGRSHGPVFCNLRAQDYRS